MVLQDRSNTNEALILDNANPSSMDQLSVESPAFCNEVVIEEEMISDPNEAHVLSYISDSVLNDVNKQLHQIVNINDISLCQQSRCQFPYKNEDAQKDRIQQS
ncbi:hypothetical protein JTB14_004691 [Gonioctena quinquepunctata]|nr:hypothetical protein JTB14_004691 [Gonioctena quinquepunctata]